jgi:hypothetical protein
MAGNKKKYTKPTVEPQETEAVEEIQPTGEWVKDDTFDVVHPDWKVRFYFMEKHKLEHDGVATLWFYKVRATATKKDEQIKKGYEFTDEYMIEKSEENNMSLIRFAKEFIAGNR